MYSSSPVKRCSANPCPTWPTPLRFIVQHVTWYETPLWPCSGFGCNRVDQLRIDWYGAMFFFGRKIRLITQQYF